MKFLILLTLAITISCAKSNSSSEQPKNPNYPKQTARTALKRFYGNYETIEQNGKPVVNSPKLPCQTLTQIGNANLKRTYTNRTNGKVSEAVTLDSYDPETNALILADEIWISPGQILSAKGNPLYCENYTVALFADRGAWTTHENYVFYSFAGTVLKKNVHDEMRTINLTEQISVEKLPNGTFKVSIEVSSEDGTFSGNWILKKK